MFTFGLKQDGAAATDYKLLARRSGGAGEESGGAQLPFVRPDCERPPPPSLSDSVRASERSVWSGVTTTYYVCFVVVGAALCNSLPLPLLSLCIQVFSRSPDQQSTDTNCERTNERRRPPPTTRSKIGGDDKVGYSTLRATQLNEEEDHRRHGSHQSLFPHPV